METAVIYVRQSRNKPGERTTSPEVQEEACRALAAVAACDRIEVFSDLDASGKNTKGRRAFLGLIQRIKDGGVSVVAAYDQSRTFRSTRDALEFYAFMGEYPSVKVEFVHGRFDRSAVGGFTYATLAAAHEMERRMTAEKRADTDGRKASRGEARGMAPYGYRWREGSWVVHEDEAAIVRRIFADYATGDLSAKALAANLNREGAPRDFQARNKHGWMPDTVVDTLRNVAYLGKTYSGPKKTGELIRAQWPAIIDEPTFKRVARLMEGRKVRRKTAPSEHVFGRLLVCSRCGEVMRATRTQGHAYYHCRRDLAVPCSSPAVREDVLTAWADALFARLTGESAGDKIAQAIAKGVIGSDEKKRRAPGRSIASIETALERLELSWAAGRLSDDTYASERAKYEALREEVAQAATPSVPLPDFGRLLDDWRSADMAAKRRTLTRLFDALYVEDGQVTRYQPRAEHRLEAQALIEYATRGGGFRWEAPRTGRGSNLTKNARRERRTARLTVDGIRGKGGIRTLEGALHPLPA